MTKCTVRTIFVEVVDVEADISVSPSGFPADVDQLFLCRQANVGRRHCETFRLVLLLSTTIMTKYRSQRTFIT